MTLANLDLDRPLWWTVDGVLTPAECTALVERIEALGPEVAPVSLPGGPRVELELRNNARVMFDDPTLAARLFDRVRSCLPDSMCGLDVAGANERMRCYRYHPGQQFRAHYDGAFVRDTRERSLLTFMVYLNEGFEGGETRFLDLGEAAVPRTGRALLFQHRLLHEGATVTRGVKYALRSDVMYREG